MFSLILTQSLQQRSRMYHVEMKCSPRLRRSGRDKQNNIKRCRSYSRCLWDYITEVFSIYWYWLNQGHKSKTRDLRTLIESKSESKIALICQKLFRPREKEFHCKWVQLLFSNCSLSFCVNGPFQHGFVFSSFLSSYCSASLNLLWNYFNNFDQRNNFKWIAFWGVSECFFNNMRGINRKLPDIQKILLGYCDDLWMNECIARRLLYYMNALQIDCRFRPEGWLACKDRVECFLKCIRMHC